MCRAEQNPLEVFPASWPLAGRRVALIGEGVLAARKLALLAATPAEIVVFAEKAIGEAAPRPLWPQARDLEGCALVFVAFEDPDLAARGAALARAARVPVNVVDRPDLSDFHVPAIIDRGAIVVSVASGGTAPVLARDLRAAIEVAVPPSVRPLADFAKAMRAVVRAAFPDLSRRRAAWEAILRGPAGERARAGDFAVAERLAGASLAGAAPAGMVHIVGAGPGDPELLTLKAMRVLSDADLIVYDRLIDPRILDLARRDAERLYVGKARAKHALPQEEINAVLVQAAQAGRRVVRLKGGDPFIFGRGGEELAALRAAGVEAQVVPGVTAALACAAAAGAPLTHRDHAQAVTFVTGHAKTGGAPDVDWAALAGAHHTLVIYMGAASARDVAGKLLAGGRAPSTPALLVENGARPQQRLMGTRLEALAQDMAAFNPKGPALIIVGEIAALADAPAAEAYWRAAQQQQQAAA